MSDASTVLEPPSGHKKARQNRINHLDRAYERIEQLIVTCELAPGRELSLQDLQTLTGYGRTPVHHAVNRLSHDTLIIIRPRHGLRIAPIDLSRERLLLDLRRNLERFVIELATQRSSASHRNRMLHLSRTLRLRRDEMGIDEFNDIDRRIDQLFLTAAGEPFVEHTLRPLHTMFRRTGWLYHRHMPDSADLKVTIDLHLSVLDAVANGRVAAALQESDALIAFVGTMFDDLEAHIDPSLLDTSIEPLIGFQYPD